VSPFKKKKKGHSLHAVHVVELLRGVADVGYQQAEQEPRRGNAHLGREQRHDLLQEDPLLAVAVARVPAEPGEVLPRVASAS
jgi:hypothetical protein